MTTHVAGDKALEREALQRRLAEAEEAHDIAVDAWAAQADPIRLRIIAAEEWFQDSGDRKPLNIAHLDLRNLGPCPEEPLSVAMLRARLARLDDAA